MKTYTDKELLKLAAKAAGYKLDGMFTAKNPDDMLILNERGGHSVWNPLAYDGDALRLAVKLEIVPRQINGVSFAWAKDVTETIEKHNGDPYAATRRAIVRAAAEIGANL